MKRASLLIAVVFLGWGVVMILPSATVQTAAAGPARSWVRALHPTTGFNDLCGAPVFGGPDALHVTFLAAHNPTGSHPIELTPEFCQTNPDALMATWANPVFYAANGWPLPDERLLNIPYHQVPIPIDWDGRRAQVDAHAPGKIGPFPPTRSTPNEPETIATFLDVHGKMRVRCDDDGTASVRISAYGYEPNSPVTVWIVWGFPPDVGLPPVVPRPLGGFPNIAIPDKKSRVRFERTLAFCPMEPQVGPGGVPMIPLAVDLATHPDEMVNGSVPEHPLQTFTFEDSETGELFESRGVGVGIVGTDRGAFQLLIGQ